MMHDRNFSNPEPIDYARPPERPDWPQSACGGVSAVLGVAIIVLGSCFGVLHLAFVKRESDAGRLMIHIEMGTVAAMAGIGLVLALVGLGQRYRRRCAAVFGLLLNGLLIALAAIGWLLA